MEQRINNFIDAFFDNREDVGEGKLTYINNKSLLKNEPESIFIEKMGIIVKILKTVFIISSGSVF